MNPDHLRLLIIRPTLNAVQMQSDAAENLVWGTAIHESMGLKYIKQGYKTLSDGLGVARSFYGIEPDTAVDLCRRYLAGNTPGQIAIAKAIWPWLVYPPVLAKMTKVQITEALLFDLRFSTFMCRLKYWMVPAPLPDANDITALAHYWGKWYQTDDVAEQKVAWVAAYRQYSKQEMRQ